MRVATYARYSSDLQREASIADQQRILREHCAREGWAVVAEFSDAAISGSTAHRPGFQALRQLARARACDVVLAEALDRLSRDQADTAKLLKDLTFLDIRLVTLAEGEVNELHVGFKGTMNALRLKDDAAKIRRGMKGLAIQGRCPGGNSYGYDVVRAFDGDPRGARVINEAQAAIVRRIFADFVNGASAKAIAKALNREGVAPPRLQAWGPSTIRGHASRGTGILNNRLYIGELVWNRLRYVKNPDTGRRLSRVNTADTYVVTAVPHLRIVDDDLWRAAKARQETSRGLAATTLVKARRPRHLFSGLTVCATCGGGFTIGSNDRLCCYNARERDTCTNRRRIGRQELEGRVLTAMRERLFDPGCYEAFRDGFIEEMSRLRREHLASHAEQRRQLPTVERRIKEIVAAISEGFRSEALKRELTMLESQRAALIGAASGPDLPSLPRNLAEIFRATVSRLAIGPLGSSARETLRGYVDRIVIPPAGLLTVIGNPAVMLGIEPGAIGGCGGGIPPIPPDLYETAA